MLLLLHHHVHIVLLMLIVKLLRLLLVLLLHHLLLRRMLHLPNKITLLHLRLFHRIRRWLWLWLSHRQLWMRLRLWRLSKLWLLHLSCSHIIHIHCLKLLLLFMIYHLRLLLWVLGPRKVLLRRRSLRIRSGCCSLGIHLRDQLIKTILELDALFLIQVPFVLSLLEFTVHHFQNFIVLFKVLNSLLWLHLAVFGGIGKPSDITLQPVIFIFKLLQ